MLGFQRADQHPLSTSQPYAALQLTSRVGVGSRNDDQCPIEMFTLFRCWALGLLAQLLKDAAALDVFLSASTILRYPLTPASVANPSEGCPSSGVHMSG